ncbi:MAG: hypothetical protein ABIP79_11840 [Chitinophagaceae bacterium]
MKQNFLSLLAIFSALSVCAQPDLKKYPEPEFSKEVYYLKKDSVTTTVRLEKTSSKVESKAKLGGFGGSESAYQIEGGKSTTRLNATNTKSFIFSNGASAKKTNSQADSMMAANGMDPSMMQDMMGGMNDPASTIVLYKAESANGNRKILLQKNPGAMPFGSKKQKTGDKYTFSVKKIREGYWELVIDKTLPGGEYAFTFSGMGMSSSDGSVTLFAFGVD